MGSRRQKIEAKRRHRLRMRRLDKAKYEAERKYEDNNPTFDDDVVDAEYPDDVVDAEPEDEINPDPYGEVAFEKLKQEAKRKVKWWHWGLYFIGLGFHLCFSMPSLFIACIIKWSVAYFHGEELGVFQTFLMVLTSRSIHFAQWVYDIFDIAFLMDDNYDYGDDYDEDLEDFGGFGDL